MFRVTCPSTVPVYDVIRLIYRNDTTPEMQHLAKRYTCEKRNRQV